MAKEKHDPYFDYQLTDCEGGLLNFFAVEKDAVSSAKVLIEDNEYEELFIFKRIKIVRAKISTVVEDVK